MAKFDKDMKMFNGTDISKCIYTTTSTSSTAPYTTCTTTSTIIHSHSCLMHKLNLFIIRRKVIKKPSYCISTSSIRSSTTTIINGVEKESGQYNVVNIHTFIINGHYQ